LKKLTGFVWFWFYKPEIEKTKSNPNRKKPKKPESNEKNKVKLVFVLKNRIEPKLAGLNRFQFFLKKNWFD